MVISKNFYHGTTGKRADQGPLPPAGGTWPGFVRGSMAGEGRGDGGGSGGQDIHRFGQAGLEGVHGGVQGGQRAEPSQPAACRLL